MTPFQVKLREKTRIKNNLVLDLIQTTPLTIARIHKARHFDRANYADIILRLVKSEHVAEAGYMRGDNNKRAMSYIALKVEFTPPTQEEIDIERDKPKDLPCSRIIKGLDNIRWTIAPQRQHKNYTSGATLGGL